MTELLNINAGMGSRLIITDTHIIVEHAPAVFAGIMPRSSLSSLKRRILFVNAHRLFFRGSGGESLVALRVSKADKKRVEAILTGRGED